MPGVVAGALTPDWKVHGHVLSSAPPQHMCAHAWGCRAWGCVSPTRGPELLTPAHGLAVTQSLAMLHLFLASLAFLLLAGGWVGTRVSPSAECLPLPRLLLASDGSQEISQVQDRSSHGLESSSPRDFPALSDHPFSSSSGTEPPSVCPSPQAAPSLFPPW